MITCYGQISRRRTSRPPACLFDRCSLGWITPPQRGARSVAGRFRRVPVRCLASRAGASYRISTLSISWRAVAAAVELFRRLARLLAQCLERCVYGDSGGSVLSSDGPLAARPRHRSASRRRIGGCIHGGRSNRSQPEPGRRGIQSASAFCDCDPVGRPNLGRTIRCRQASRNETPSHAIHCSSPAAWLIAYPSRHSRAASSTTFPLSVDRRSLVVATGTRVALGRSRFLLAVVALPIHSVT